MRVLMIDNFDSFTYNLVQYLGELGCEVLVYRNNALTPGQLETLAPRAIVISPGPGHPDQAGICLELIRACAGRLPLLGVCLGHQAIARAFGGEVLSAGELVHGKTSPIFHDGSVLFSGLESPFPAARYHSLIVSEATLPGCLQVTARTASGLIMALAHRRFPVFGLQFHPESFLTEAGKTLMANFLEIARHVQQPHPVTTLRSKKC